MVVHCFCSRCGRELHRASKWTTPVRPMFEEDAPVLLAIEPCEHCAPRNEGRRLPVKHCIYGTTGHNPDDRITLECIDHYVAKNTFGTRYLAQEIDAQPDNYDEIVMCGGYTSICLLANAVILRSEFPDTPISVRADLCFDKDEESHNAALAVLRNQRIDVKCKGDKNV